MKLLYNQARQSHSVVAGLN